MAGGDFLGWYYQRAAAEEIAGLDAMAREHTAARHRQVAQQRSPREAIVEVRAASGATPAPDVVDIVVDDMPFLVDSITAELNRLDVGIHLLLHPQLVVRRDADGTLLDVVGAYDAAAAPGTQIESWMHVAIDRQADDAARQTLRDHLLRVLGDVRAAVEDWRPMAEQARRIADEAAAAPSADDDAAETALLLRWLAEGYFVFVGYREYTLQERDGETALAVVPGSGLGILRTEPPASRSFAALPPEVRARAHDRVPVVVTKANSRSTVHRPVYLDYVGVRTFDDAGNVTGERRFLGLFTSGAYTESVRRVPLVRRKVAAVEARSGLPAMSHDGKNLAEILETYPRDELFQASVDQLFDTAMKVLRLQERRRVRVFLREDVYRRFVSCLVYLPRDRYTTHNRLAVQGVLMDALRGTSIDYTIRVTESVLARLHFVVRVDPAAPLDVNVPALEERLGDAIRSWDDDFADAVRARAGERAQRLLSEYGDAFPEGYKEDFAVADAVEDIGELESLDGPDEIRVVLYDPPDAAEGVHRFKVYRRGEAISLSQVLPYLQSMGVEVTDERPYEVVRSGNGTAWIYDLGLRLSGAASWAPVEQLRPLFEDAFVAAWQGRIESDGFQALVPQAGLTWREVVVLRAIARYLRQVGWRFNQEMVERVLVANAGIARLLVRLFETRLDPSSAAEPAGRAESRERTLVTDITRAVDDVASLDDDRVLRSYLRLTLAIRRTNYWHDRADALSFKVDPAQVPGMPEPRPAFEIFVYSPRVEAVHLRFGAVARGGLRWSDRRADFRTEVLGLAKTQEVKNAVIVPAGAKGAFVVKQPPRPDDRDAVAAEVRACYSAFIRGMLDITDNLVPDGAGGTRVVHPERVRCLDGDDSYLVVAADKGTATFSDLANSISAEYGYWLGDAFASGGSVGYDHKGMGITARGAWESVLRHFRTLGVDPATTDFTAVGIGDMSGDVFGNGMLRSRHLRLIAAFDHRHVFIDPDPDPAVSFDERARLFALPRSSWADYDPALISAGGGVWARTAKSVPVSEQARRVLGIDAEELAPNELISAILCAPVDLLWNGGIGTYVKATSETAADVGDRANDGVRVDGARLRCRVVGEGGNLGFTQRGRIEYALGGGHINTDAIDNSAGVDTSDHEVNIKILLDAAVAQGALDPGARDELIHATTDDVAELVLRDNYDQNLLLSCEQGESSSLLYLHAALIDSLVSAGRLDRDVEKLPSAEQLAQRGEAGIGLVRPELAVLCAYVKNTAAQDLLAAGLADDPFAARSLPSYFPAAIRDRFADLMTAHPLRREIVTTMAINSVVNVAGPTFLHRTSTYTGAGSADVVRAHLAGMAACDVDRLWAGIQELDGAVAGEDQLRMFLAARRIADRAARWFLANRKRPLDIDAEVASMRDGVAGVLAAVPDLAAGVDAEQWEEERAWLLEAGAPADLARSLAGAASTVDALTAVDIAGRTGVPVLDVAGVHFLLGDALQLARLRHLVVGLPRDTRWNTMARAALREDLSAAHAVLTVDVLEATSAGESRKRIDTWVAANADAVQRALDVLGAVTSGHADDLAAVSVALREIRALVRAVSLARE